jgi:hypothetical protein
MTFLLRLPACHFIDPTSPEKKELPKPYAVVALCQGKRPFARRDINCAPAMQVRGITGVLTNCGFIEAPHASGKSAEIDSRKFTVQRFTNV